APPASRQARASRSVSSATTRTCVLSSFYKLMHETIAVGRAAGVEFPPEFPAELDRSVAAFPPMLKASMTNDLDAGNRLELDWLAGKVVALGRKYGIPTPAQEAVWPIRPCAASSWMSSPRKPTNRISHLPHPVQRLPLQQNQFPTC